MTHESEFTPEEIIGGLPYMIADLERLQRDMVSTAVAGYDGRVLDMAGVLEHMIGHFHDVREALNLSPVDTIMEEMGDADN
jgi:hypothetical protein